MSFCDLMMKQAHMSHFLRKPAFCICKKYKDADQLGGDCAADQSFCFHYKASTIHLLPKSLASSHLYTPGIYAEGYIVFVFPFICSLVRSFVEFASKFCVKVYHVVYISATTHQKAFIFGP